LFSPLIRSCSAQRFHKIRTVASWALAAITPLEEIQDECSLLFASLEAKGCNDQHGILLQVQSLLDTFARNTWGAGTQAANVLQVTEGLVRSLVPQVSGISQLFAPSQAQFRPPLASTLLDITYLLSGSALI